MPAVFPVQNVGYSAADQLVDNVMRTANEIWVVILGTFAVALWMFMSLALYLLTTDNQKYDLPPFLVVWPGVTYLFWRWLRRIQ